MPEHENKAAPKRRKERPAETVPVVPYSAILIARYGGLLAMVPAAAISAQTLYHLARLMGLTPGVAWLLPTALDIYAITAILVSVRVPSGHGARKAAIGNARFALGLTILCNALTHALYLAGHGHGWSRTDIALTVVSALPPIVVERLLHLQAIITTGGSETETAAALEPAAATARPTATVATPGTGIAAPRPASGNGSPAAAAPAIPGGSGKPHAPVVDISGNGRRSADSWALLAMPLWHEYTAGHNGTTPTAPVLADLLRTAHPDLLVPGSERSERNIRSATEKLASPAEAEPERAEATAR